MTVCVVKSYQSSAIEELLLERIWLQMNVRQGAFLRRNSFERLFVAADGTVGSSLGTLPFLLIFGLISDPARVLSYNPNLEDAGRSRAVGAALLKLSVALALQAAWIRRLGKGSLLAAELVPVPGPLLERP